MKGNNILDSKLYKMFKNSAKDYEVEEGTCKNNGFKKLLGKKSKGHFERSIWKADNK